MFIKNALSLFSVTALVIGVAIPMGDPAHADPATVPTTGSEQGMSVPHADPGSDSGPRTPQSERSEAQGSHLTSQPLVGRDTGSAATPGFANPTSEAAPHTDVQSNPALVPQTGSAQGVNPPGSLPK